MAKAILLNNTSKDLRDTTLLCINLGTLLKIITTSGAMKPKVSKANGMKACLCQNTLSHVWSLCLKQH
jgi:hypothetical protein